MEIRLKVAPHFHGLSGEGRQGSNHWVERPVEGLGS